MPTPTDLVTDLPADFEVFGQAVDTSMADLKGGTTGQILSKATNTDMDFTWITNDVGDITAVNVTAPITGGGASGAVTIGVSAASTSASGVVQLSDSTSTTSSVLASTPTATKSAYDLANTANTAAGTAQTTANAAIPKSTVTTSGDVIYATGSAAVTRLGIGSTGQVLTVAAGIPSWSTPVAGGMTQISSTALSGSSVSLTSIPSTYKNLRLVVRDVYPSVAATLGLQVNTDTGSNYNFFGYNYDGVNVPATVRQAAGTVVYLNYSAAKATDNNNTVIIDFNDYANTATVKQIQSTSACYVDTTNVWGGSFLTTIYNSTSAISSIQFKTLSGTFSGGTAILYGVN